MEGLVSDLVLVIANKAYSSWSMRPWLALKMTETPFEEIVVPLRQKTTAAAIAVHSPAGKVPVLHHGTTTVWDSLAILEYLAELLPFAGLWPVDRQARAVARAVSAEMHSGFGALRSDMPMNVRAILHGRGRAAGVDADIARIGVLWRDCRARFGDGGPFLFGRFCIADAMYAPVATRFRTHGVEPELDDVGRAYVATLLELPPVLEWYAAAHAEPWVIAEYEAA